MGRAGRRKLGLKGPAKLEAIIQVLLLVLIFVLVVWLIAGL
jgi:hypothetical protein